MGGIIERIVNPPEPADQDDRRPRSSWSGPRMVADTFANHWRTLIGMNVLTLVAMLPVVTAPAVLAAATSVCSRLQDGRLVFLWHDLTGEFRRLFSRAMRIGLPWCLFIALGMTGTVFYTHAGIPGGVVLAAVCLAIAVWAWIAGMFVFPMIVETDLPTRQVWRNAALLTVLHMPRVLLTMLAEAAILAVGVLLVPWTIWVMPLFGLSLMVLIGTIGGRRSVHTTVIRSDVPTSTASV